MEGEPVDRRGLLRDMFRQARAMVIPAIASGALPAGATVGGRRSGLPESPATAAQLRTAAVELGLGSRAGAAERLVRCSLRLAATPQGVPGDVAFGGPALMSEGSRWPSWQGRPLTLLAQVETGRPLGRLLFFYDAVGRPTGCLAAHRGSACVLQANELPRSPREGPAMPMAAVPGALASELVLPGVSSPPVRALGLTPAEQEAWKALRERLAEIQGGEPADRPGAGFTVVHRIFGYPDTADTEMGLTCELAGAGEDVIEGRAHVHPRAGELGGRAERWELLAQLSWDGKLSWPWAAQRIYFWTDRDALASGVLGETWAIAR
jgi:hypothetical protein